MEFDESRLPVCHFTNKLWMEHTSKRPFYWSMYLYTNNKLSNEFDSVLYFKKMQDTSKIYTKLST